MTVKQLKESGVLPGWKARIVKEWCDGCLENSEGKMDKWLGTVMTVTEVYHDHLFMKEDIGCRVFDKTKGWCWYAAAIEEVFPPYEDKIAETATDDELAGLLFG